MSIQISDCSLRDGGYVGNKNFSTELIEGVIDGLVRAGIDYIETGFLQNNVTGESLVYANSKEVRKYIPNYKGKSQFVGFCDNSRYCIENLDECDGKSFTNLRISFAKHERKDALEFCRKAKDKGYQVFVQPMDAIGYTMAEREEMIRVVNEFQPEAFAIVDTFGAMHLDDLCSVFKQIDTLLDKNIKVGLHTHNNLNIANALGEYLINMAAETERSVAVDGSLLGMARGAGNSCTEELAAYINSRYGTKYDIGVLIETIEKYIVPLKKTTNWGYDIPMFICGIQGAHVDNISHMEKLGNCNYKDMYEVVGKLTPNQRKRYGENYSKTDFSLLNQMIENYKNEV